LNAEETRKATMDYESLASLKSMLGSGAVTPFNTATDVPRYLQTIARFYAHESCGQCTPCREGTGYVDRVLDKVVEGHGDRNGDLELIKDLADSYEWTTICAFAPGAAWPVQSFITKFRYAFPGLHREEPRARQAARARQLQRAGAFW
jgi:NADH-quinone oxidoreductase subunit F